MILRGGGVATALHNQNPVFSWLQVGNIPNVYHFKLADTDRSNHLRRFDVPNHQKTLALHSEPEVGVDSSRAEWGRHLSSINKMWYIWLFMWAVMVSPWGICLDWRNAVDGSLTMHHAVLQWYCRPVDHRSICVLLVVSGHDCTFN